MRRAKFYVIFLSFMFLASNNTVFAAFDLDKGIAAATTPLLEVVKKYYGVAIALGASVGAITGQGDLRTRGISAAIGAGVAAGVILAVLTALA